MAGAVFLFRGDLAELLSVPHEQGRVAYPLTRRASVKDIIEALGIPHTEVGALFAGGSPVDFTHTVEEGEQIEALPPAPPVDVRLPTLLRPLPLAEFRFVADLNVAKLGRLLRMAGFDVQGAEGHDDAGLAGLAARGRIVLSRDRLLLRRKKVVFGRLLRAQDPHVQLREVVDFFGLAPLFRPFSRCLCCNGLLEPVAKEAVLHLLEPLTRKYYEEFHRCRECGRLYWPGSHRPAMERVLRDLRAWGGP